jgi:phenylalanyl-tRNA synthetase beta chain
MEVMRKQNRLDLARRLRERLCALGFSQAVLTNFEDPGRLAGLGLKQDDPRLRAVKIANPLSENESILRTTLVPKLVSCLALNRSRGAFAEVRIYELGAVFEDAGEELPRQRNAMAGLISPALEKTLWNSGCPADGFYDVKAVAESLVSALRFPGARFEPAPEPDPYFHPGKCARLMIGAAEAGQVGELHPRVARSLQIKNQVFLFEFSFDMLAERADYVPKAEPVSKFPPARRDIAVVVDETVTMEDIIKTARKVKVPEAELGLNLFDVFRGGNITGDKKSMAFHVSYQSLTRTLTDEEVNAAHQRLSDQLQRSVGAVLR